MPLFPPEVFSFHLMNKFDDNLKTAKEDYPQKTFEEHLAIAREWTQEQVCRELAHVEEFKKAQHQDATNKEHFG
jgi:hypothetical protein